VLSELKVTTWGIGESVNRNYAQKQVTNLHSYHLMVQFSLASPHPQI